MYQQQQSHLNGNWRPYHIGPPLPASPNFYLSPRCGPSVLQLSSNVYSLCSPVGPRMNHPSKPPAGALFPTLMTVHPGNHRGPVIGLSPMVRGHAPVYHREHHPYSNGTPSGRNLTVGNREMPRKVSAGSNLSMKNEQADRRPISPEIVDLTSDSDPRSPALCRKRCASPSESERKLKKQREVAQSYGDNRTSFTQVRQVTPVKFRERPSPAVLREAAEQLGEKLDSSIRQLYTRHKQTDDLLEKKMKLRTALHNIIKPIFPSCGLYMVGSSMTGLAASNSDLDLCLVISQTEIDQQSEAIVHLRDILNRLRYCNFIHKCQLIHAKVPILKFVDKVSGVEVDLNVNNIVGIRNTQLINNYSQIDERVPPLCLVVKLWAKTQNINDPFNKTLSSYSLILMVLHYLQVGCDPPVLPCLHKLMPTHFSNTSDICSLSRNLDVPPFNARNHQNLGELLLGFFNYYGYVFNFQERVISVRLAGTLPKDVAKNCRSPKNRPSQWNYICIEEPFDRTNTARSVFDKIIFDRIRKAFAISLDTLNKTLDLDSILSFELGS